MGEKEAGLLDMFKMEYRVDFSQKIGHLPRLELDLLRLCLDANKWMANMGDLSLLQKQQLQRKGPI